MPTILITNTLIIIILCDFVFKTYNFNIFIGKATVGMTLIAPFLWWEKKWNELKQNNNTTDIDNIIKIADNFHELLFINILCIGIATIGALLLSLFSIPILLHIGELIVSIWARSLSQNERGWIIATSTSIIAFIILIFSMRFMLKRRRIKKELQSKKMQRI